MWPDKLMSGTKTTMFEFAGTESKQKKKLTDAIIA